MFVVRSRDILLSAVSAVKQQWGGGKIIFYLHFRNGIAYCGVDDFKKLLIPFSFLPLISGEGCLQTKCSGQEGVILSCKNANTIELI
jgi:hypothetical protein